VLLTGQAGEDYGRAVSGAGDVNGDGFGDIAVAAIGVGARTGAVYVHVGGAGGAATTAATILLGPGGANRYFGHSIAGAGDVDRDGYADLIVGTEELMTHGGHAYFYRGSAVGLPPAPSVTLSGADTVHGLFGASVASIDRRRRPGV
jgi:hypothetical protein